MMPKWIDDLFRNIDVWILRRLHKLLQHGDATFAGIDTLHADLAQKEQYRDGVYLHLKERLEGTDEHPLAEGVPVRPLPATQDLEHLQETVELLGERKISLAQAPDGITIPRLLLDASVAESITELVDDNTWGEITGTFPYNTFPNLRDRLVIGCSSIKNNGSQMVYNIHCDADILELPNLTEFYKDTSKYVGVMAYGKFTQFIAPKLKGVSDSPGWHEYFLSYYYNTSDVYNLKKVVLGTLEVFNWSFGGNYNTGGDSPCTKFIHFEIGDGTNINLNCGKWNPTNALRTDTTASDYIDLREDKDEQGKFINATNLEQFLANFRKYIILRVANRTGGTALTLTLSAAVYQSIYGLDSSNNADNNSWARTHTLADLGLTEDDLTEAEQAAGITVNTIYATWLDTYRSAINWNIGH